MGACLTSPGDGDAGRFWVADLLLVVVFVGFVLSFFDARLVGLNTHPSGGDMASWSAEATHLRDVLLPRARVTGWDMGHFAGQPSFRFYFLPPFLLAVLAAKLAPLPLAVALKGVMLAGMVLLPVTTYAGLRMMGCRFPSPVTGAAAALVLLMNEGHTMFGGNALSTLAGEFCYMLAFALLPLFAGRMHRDAWQGRHAASNGALLGLIGLCHPFVFIPALALPVYGVLTRVKLGYVLRLGVSAAGTMAWWLLPLLALRHPYTTPIAMVWNDLDSAGSVGAAGLAAACILALPVCVRLRAVVGGRPVVDGLCRWAILGATAALGAAVGWQMGVAVSWLGVGLPGSPGGWPWPRLMFAGIVAVVGAMAGARRGQSGRPGGASGAPDRLGVWLALLSGGVVAFFGAHFLQVPDIRFLPVAVFALAMVVATEVLGPVLGASAGSVRLMGALTVCGLALVVATAGAKRSASWYDYNYRGFQQAPGWPEFAALNRYLRQDGMLAGGDPLDAGRVGYEKCDLYGAYGGDRAFESIPLFSGRATLEGIHYAGALGARQVAFLQTTFSRDVKSPEPLVAHRMDAAAAAAYCRLYNVSHLVVATAQAKDLLAGSPAFVREADFGPLALFRLSGGPGGYVQVLSARPVRYQGTDWARAFYHWFRDYRNLDVPLVPDSLVTDPQDRAALAGPAGVNEPRAAGDTVRVDMDHHRIRFTTDRVGVPHLVKVSYFPTWSVTGANGVYPVSPHFMLVIPRQATVTLYYGRSPWEIAGVAVTGAWLLAWMACGLGRRRVRAWTGRLAGPHQALVRGADAVERVTTRLRPWGIGAAIGVGVVLVVAGAALRNRPVRTFQHGEAAFRSGLELSARGLDRAAADAFKEAVAVMSPLLEDRRRYDHRDVANCMLRTAASLERLGRDGDAQWWYRTLLHEFHFSRYEAEIRVNLGRLYRRRADAAQDPVIMERMRGESRNQFRRAMAAQPGSAWADLARHDLPAKNP